jgi:hypothetical protein
LLHQASSVAKANAEKELVLEQRNRSMELEPRKKEYQAGDEPSLEIAKERFSV